MADVQLEHGFVRIAMALYEALMRVRMPGRHKDVVHAMIRLTYGFGRTQDRIASSQVAELIDEDVANVRSMRRDLVSWGVLAELDSGPGRVGMWRVVKDFELWKIGQTATAKRMARVGKTRVVPHPGSATPRVVPHPGVTTPGGRVVPHPETRVVPHPDQRKKIVSKDRERAAAPLTRSKGAIKHPPPERLSDDQRARLVAWCQAKHPTLVGRIDELIEACLRYSKREGQTKWRADYYAACQDWIDREQRPRGDAPKGGRAKVSGLDDWAWAMEGKSNDG